MRIGRSLGSGRAARRGDTGRYSHRRPGRPGAEHTDICGIVTSKCRRVKRLDITMQQDLLMEEIRAHHFMHTKT